MRKFALIDHMLRDISNEALGYWTAKLEIMKKNKMNVKTRTDKKEEHKNKLKEMLKTMSKKECRIKAQEKFGITDRTVLNYLHEIELEREGYGKRQKIKSC